MQHRSRHLRRTPLLLAIALSGELPQPCLAQPAGQEQPARTDAAPDDDGPSPSMAMLEFIALFETADGQWMDPESIPLSLDPGPAGAAADDRPEPPEADGRNAVPSDRPNRGGQHHAM